MAVKPCKECGKDVSSKAKSCPHCGAPVKRSTGLLRGLMLGVFALVAIGYCSTLFEVPTGLPMCEAGATETAVRDALENSPQSRLVNQRFLAMRDHVEVSFDESKPERHCKATVFLNSGQFNIRYRLFKSKPDDTQFLVWVETD